MGGGDGGDDDHDSAVMMSAPIPVAAPLSPTSVVDGPDAKVEKLVVSELSSARREVDHVRREWFEQNVKKYFDLEAWSSQSLGNQQWDHEKMKEGLTQLHDAAKDLETLNEAESHSSSTELLKKAEATIKLRDQLSVCSTDLKSVEDATKWGGVAEVLSDDAVKRLVADEAKRVDVEMNDVRALCESSVKQKMTEGGSAKKQVGDGGVRTKWVRDLGTMKEKLAELDIAVQCLENFPLGKSQEGERLVALGKLTLNLRRTLLNELRASDPNVQDVRSWAASHPFLVTLASEDRRFESHPVRSRSPLAQHRYFLTLPSSQTRPRRHR